MKTALWIGIVFSFISGCFTVDFFASRGVSGIAQMKYAAVGIMFAVAQAYSLYYGVRMWDRLRVATYCLIFVFSLLCGVSVFATVDSLTASTFTKGTDISNLKSGSLQTELDSLLKEKIVWTEQIAKGNNERTFARVVTPAKEQLKKVETRIEEIQTELEKREQPDDLAFLGISEFFGGSSAQSARQWIYFLIAMMIEVIAAIFIGLSATIESVYTPRRTEYTPDFAVYTPAALLPSPSGAYVTSPETPEKKRLRELLANNPGISGNKICREFGVTPSGPNINRIKKTYPDLFASAA